MHLTHFLPIKFYILNFLTLTFLFLFNIFYLIIEIRCYFFNLNLNHSLKLQQVLSIGLGERTDVTEETVR